MKINEIEKNEWKEVFDLYFEEKKRCGDSVTIEDVLGSISRCESCGKLVFSDDLFMVENSGCGILHYCDECYQEELDDEKYFTPGFEEPDDYQEYIDYQLVSE